MPLPFGAKLTYKPLFQPNSPCPDCPPDPSLCSPSNELTAQCTDQCVVIACTDPNHAESVCNSGGSDTHCDAVCKEGEECEDCHGFDSILQCCEDYHPYNIEPTRPLFQHPIDMSWTGSFDDLWCSCNQHSTAVSSRVASSERNNEPSTQAHFNIDRGPTPFSSKPTQHFHHNSFHISGFIPPVQSPPEIPPSTSCLWDSCQGSFPSMSELVGHVNSHLLDFLPHNADGSVPYQSDGPASMSCLWGDCNSSYSSWPSDFDLLAQHLLNDHLGITSPFPDPQQLPNSPTNQLMIPSVPTFEVVSQTHASDLDPPIFNDSSSSSKSRSSTPIAKSDTSSSELIECRWKDCGKYFNSCDELTLHINTDHIGGGKAHYECFWDQCPRNGNQGFQSKQKISRHVQSHTGHRPFQCNICHQNFSEAATLQQHIRRHTQEKPYVCDFPGCGKSFAITGALTIHKRTHNGDKPFKCTYCDRGFAESSNLSKHLRTHTGARPYTCMEPGCSKSFARPDQLNRHKAVHRKQVRGITRTALQ
ncbi:hypothetical protein CPB84DRAFT_1673452 [Gymnopilus junonius]|uniref:C2H2-type domain-containing protein n=1 Tax=Gymnopilus junonius TaxID=109634 RepID=A0A9P5NZ38_GYMJU|nr:hypothetical protein CPB84DRAFT_1673452 [Gymnopilus junonius]